MMWAKSSSSYVVGTRCRYDVRSLKALVLTALLVSFVSHNEYGPIATAFVVHTNRIVAPAFPSLQSTKSSSRRTASVSSSADDAPQVFGTGYSALPDLMSAVNVAVGKAAAKLPPGYDRIDLAVLTISSLYDNQSVPMATVVPTLLSSASALYGGDVRRVIGCTAGGIVSTNDNGDVVETDGALGVSVTLALLPDVELRSFHVTENEIDAAKVASVDDRSWQHTVGKKAGWGDDDDKDDDRNDGTFLLIPSPAFQPSLTDLLTALSTAHPDAVTFGGMASTVSALTRARLFLYSDDDDGSDGATTVYNDGCIGMAMRGDLEVKIMTAQGTKPVGKVYKVVTGQDCTIGTIVVADNNKSNNDDSTTSTNTSSNPAEAVKEAYLSATIPKPVLAEANLMIKAGTLSDDNVAFLKKTLLIGLERPIDDDDRHDDDVLRRLATGQGHAYLVKQVASAGMKDGSVTFPLNSVDVTKGTRMRFFVRESDWCTKEVRALWQGYETTLARTTHGDDPTDAVFTPTGCLMMSTLDRGSKLFGGSYKEGAEVSGYLPTVDSIAGFYGTGILSALDGSFYDNNNGGSQKEETILHGSGSCYAVFGSKTKRPIFNGAQSAALEDQQTRDSTATSSDDDDPAAPRMENGELLLRRREIHSGRSLTVSTVEWSVAENVAKPTSALEGFMWDKETEVDRFRERVPLANLLSQVKDEQGDPESRTVPRDWVGRVRAMSDDDFVLVPECKRTDALSSKPLRERYDVSRLAGQFVQGGGAQALSVNCDSILFGGSLEDVHAVRTSLNDNGNADVPLLASDLLLYPYQLYKLRLAGADAVSLVAGALAGKDLLYLAKIAKSLKFQTVVSVTSEVQISLINKILGPGVVDCLVLSNRDLETFGFDDTGEQALRLLGSDALREFKAKHEDEDSGHKVLYLVEGRVGMEALGKAYTEKLRTAGADGAIVGEGLAVLNEEDGGEALKMLRSRTSSVSAV